MTINEKLELISYMENEQFAEALIEDVVKSFESSNDVAYVCNTPEELKSAIADMSEEDDSVENS